MKKLISLLLAVLMVLSLVGCDLFSDASVVKFDEIYTHKDPEGIEYDKRIALKNEKFNEMLTEYVNETAYPDTLITDKDGNNIGMYDYDPETGLAKGWTSFDGGKYTEYAKGKEVDLGKPDESKMISLSGSVAMLAVVYGKDGTATEADCYLILSDAKDKDTVLSGMDTAFMVTYTAESDTVLKYTADKKAIAEELEMYAEDPENVDYSPEAYAENLKQGYSLREHTGETFKAYKGITDPDLEFDESIKLCNTGEYAVTDEFVSDIKQVTDVVYGKDGKVVAHDSYFEFKSKDAADKAMDLGDNGFIFNPERVEDTVIKGTVSGKKLESIIENYKGYNILEDDSYESYAKMVEETYFSVACD